MSSATLRPVVSDRRWWMFTAGGSVCVGGVAGLAHPVFGCLFAAGVLVTRVATDTRRRRTDDQRYDAAFIAFIEAVAAYLRSGETVTSALGAVTINEPALATDRDRFVAAQVLGAPVGDALTTWPRRDRSEVIAVGTVAIAIAHRYGMRIAAALEHLAMTLRDRAALRADARVQAIHARLSAYVISAAPLVFVALGAGLDPQFLATVFTTRAGRVCIALGLAFESAGWCAMYFIVRDPADRRGHALERDVPIITDFVGLALGAGYPPIGAIAFARRWSPPSAAAVLGHIEARLARGDSLAQALAAGIDRAPVLGPALRVLLAAGNGAPVQILVSRLADDARLQIKARADARARAIPVRLLFPLVLCILPAFALLTVAPAVISGLHGIR